MFLEVRGEGAGDRGDEVGVWGVVGVGLWGGGFLRYVVEGEGGGGEGVVVG